LNKDQVLTKAWNPVLGALNVYLGSSTHIGGTPTNADQVLNSVWNPNSGAIAVNIVGGLPTSTWSSIPAGAGPVNIAAGGANQGVTLSPTGTAPTRINGPAAFNGSIFSQSGTPDVFDFYAPSTQTSLCDTSAPLFYMNAAYNDTFLKAQCNYNGNTSYFIINNCTPGTGSCGTGTSVQAVIHMYGGCSPASGCQAGGTGTDTRIAAYSTAGGGHVQYTAGANSTAFDLLDYGSGPFTFSTTNAAQTTMPIIRGKINPNGDWTIGASNPFNFANVEVHPGFQQSAVVYNGAGLNDLSLYLGGAYASKAHSWQVCTDGSGAPDTFKWSADGGSFTTGVPITGANQTLQDNMQIQFASTTGHNNDCWAWTTSLNHVNQLAVYDGAQNALFECNGQYDRCGMGLNLGPNPNFTWDVHTDNPAAATVSAVENLADGTGSQAVSYWRSVTANMTGGCNSHSYSSPDACQFTAAGASQLNFIITGNYPIGFATNGTTVMKITGSGNVGIGTSSPAATLDVRGSLLVQRPITAKTGNYTVSTSDSNTWFTNNGAAGEVDFTLPACTTAGYTLSFDVEAAQILKIIANGTDTLRNGATVSATGGRAQANTVGSVLRIVCGASGKWTTESIIGTWTIT
jgi:hypothetical protein